MFPENTLVRTGFEEHSFTPIQMLRVGSPVVTHENRLRKVTAISTIENYSGNVRLVTAQNYSYQLRCFPRVQLLLYHNLRYLADPDKEGNQRIWDASWRQVSNVAQHDFIRLSRPLSNHILGGVVKTPPTDPDAAYTSIKDIIFVSHVGMMYGFTVEEDNSFIANGFTVRI